MSLENESQLQSAQESAQALVVLRSGALRSKKQETAQALVAFKSARQDAVAIQRKAGPAQQQPGQEKLVTPDPKAEIRTFSRQGGKEVPVAPKEKPDQEKPDQEKAEQEERRPHSHQGLQGLATLCSGLPTNSVSAGAVSPT
jgi:hypothetical protein